MSAQQNPHCPTCRYQQLRKCKISLEEDWVVDEIKHKFSRKFPANTEWSACTLPAQGWVPFLANPLPPPHSTSREMSAFISVIAALVLLSNSSPLVGGQSFSLDVRMWQAECFCLEYRVRNDDFESESWGECSFLWKLSSWQLLECH